MCSTSKVQLPEERDKAIAKQPVPLSSSFVVAGNTAAFDNPASCSYILVSIPAGPLSQDMLSLGGFFIGGKV